MKLSNLEHVATGTVMAAVPTPEPTTASAPVDASTGPLAGHLGLADYPALASLRLAESDLQELSHQGSICSETRGAFTFTKLRFRRHNQQTVRYIGDAQAAAAVRAELDQLQQNRQVLSNARRKDREARRALRQYKKQLEPVIQEHGLRFHGLALRKSRASTDWLF